MHIDLGSDSSYCFTFKKNDQEEFFKNSNDEEQLFKIRKVGVSFLHG